MVRLWKTFRALRPDFVSSFAAYQHFRTKGWVPKGGGGAKYGVDFSKTRPPTCRLHAAVTLAVWRSCDQSVSVSSQCCTGRGRRSTTAGNTRSPAQQPQAPPTALTSDL